MALELREGVDRVRGWGFVWLRVGPQVVLQWILLTDPRHLERGAKKILQRDCHMSRERIECIRPLCNHFHWEITSHPLGLPTFFIYLLSFPISLSVQYSNLVVSYVSTFTSILSSENGDRSSMSNKWGTVFSVLQYQIQLIVYSFLTFKEEYRMNYLSIYL